MTQTRKQLSSKLTEANMRLETLNSATRRTLNERVKNLEANNQQLVKQLTEAGGKIAMLADQLKAADQRINDLETQVSGTGE